MYSTDTAGFLNASSPQFYRPNTIGRITYYHAYRFTVSVSGMYMFSTNSSIDTYGLLYDGEMDPSFPSNSLLANNDDGGPGYGLQFKIIANLQAGSTYAIVVTTHGALITGAFRLVASGPVLLTLNSFLPVTSQPIFTTSEFLLWARIILLHFLLLSYLFSRAYVHCFFDCEWIPHE